LLRLLDQDDERGVALAPGQQGLPVKRRGCLRVLLLLLLLLLRLQLLLLLLLLLLVRVRVGVVVMMVVGLMLRRRRLLLLLGCERHEERWQGGRVGRGRRRRRPRAFA